MPVGKTVLADWKSVLCLMTARCSIALGRLPPTSDTTFNATAGDVVGAGTGATAGNALNLKYVLEIDYNDKKLKLNVDDWMWRVDEHTVINQSTLSKWGFTVGTIQLVISRPH